MAIILEAMGGDWLSAAGKAVRWIKAADLLTSCWVSAPISLYRIAWQRGESEAVVLSPAPAGWRLIAYANDPKASENAAPLGWIDLRKDGGVIRPVATTEAEPARVLLEAIGIAEDLAGAADYYLRSIVLSAYMANLLWLRPLGDSNVSWLIPTRSIGSYPPLKRIPYQELSGLLEANSK